jgi:hypothetical protein
MIRCFQLRLQGCRHIKNTRLTFMYCFIFTEQFLGNCAVYCEA